MTELEYIRPTPRSSMTQKRRVKIFLAHNGKCCICTKQIRPGQKWIIEHPNPLALGGSDEDKDLAPAHEKCGRIKTKTDVEHITERDQGIDRDYADKRRKGRGFQKAPPGYSFWTRRIER